MKLTSNDIRQLIKEELNKLLKENRIYRCRKDLKDIYDYYFKRLKNVFKQEQGWWAWRKYKVGDLNTYHTAGVGGLEEKMDTVVYIAARMYDCPWAEDLLRKWQDGYFYRTSIEFKEAPWARLRIFKNHLSNTDFHALVDWFDEREGNFDPDQDRWALPQAELDRRREERRKAIEMGDEEIPIQEPEKAGDVE